MTARAEPVVWIGVHDLGRTGVPIVLVATARGACRPTAPAAHARGRDARRAAREQRSQRAARRSRCWNRRVGGRSPGPHRSAWTCSGPGRSRGLASGRVGSSGGSTARAPTSCWCTVRVPGRSLRWRPGRLPWCSTSTSCRPGSTVRSRHHQRRVSGRRPRHGRERPGGRPGPSIAGRERAASRWSPVSSRRRPTAQIGPPPAATTTGTGGSWGRARPGGARAPTAWRRWRTRFAADPARTSVSVGRGRPSGPDAVAVAAADPVHWFDERADPGRCCGAPRSWWCPSREDPLPLVALEAGVRARPVVAMPTGRSARSAGGRAGHGRASVTTSAGSTTRWLACWTDPDEARAMGSALRERVSGTASRDVVVPWWGTLVDAAGR